MNQQDYVVAIEQLVQGEMPLGNLDKVLAINMALKEHSRHKPRTVVMDIDGDGGFDYPIADNLDDWADGFSVIKTVEYPVDDDDEIPSVLEDDAWTIYEKPDGKVLRFLEDKPAATEDIRITHTAVHTCTSSACTVAGFDDEAVQALAAAYLCDMMATFYAQSGDSTIGADAVDHKSKADEYARRGTAYRKLYYDHIGVAPGSVKPATGTKDLDVNYPWGWDRLTHPRKER